MAPQGTSAAPRVSEAQAAPRVVGDVLRASARRAPSSAAIAGEEATLTHAALDAEADRLAAALAGAGFAPGSCIGAMLPNSLDYGLLFFAAARAGLVLANLPTRAAGRELAEMAALAGMRGLFVHRDLAPQVAAARAAGAEFARVVETGGPEPRDLAAAVSARAGSLPAVSPADLLSINFTGGTTGRPKAVAVTHGARAASIAGAVALFGNAPGDACIVSTPMFHTVGLHVWFGAVVGAGACAVPLARWDAARFLDLVERHRAAAALLVPTQMLDILRAPQFLPRRLEALRRMHHAGAPMHLALLGEFAEALPWIETIEHYGQSETGPIALRPSRFNRTRAQSVGPAVPGVELRVVEHGGRALRAGEVGEVLVRGPNLLREYLGDADATREAFRFGDGWLATGDVGFLAEDGFLTLVDRAKDMIVSGAENLYPVEVENALLRHPAVGECAVFGIPDERWGEVPIAHVVLREGMEASAQELIDFVEAQTARWKRPRAIEFVAALPRTPVGKVQKNLLREPYWKGRARRI